MPLFALLILAIVQGITEFLPISSSGHLYLTWELFDLSGAAVVQGNSLRLDYDIAVHAGTLFAVCWYLRAELRELVQDSLTTLSSRQATPGAWLMLCLGLATLPIVIFGYLFEDFVETSLRSLGVIGWTTLVFGLVLYLADRLGSQARMLDTMTLPAALLIGLAQVLALVPGTSRSGITMTAGRALGFSRLEAARFSLLLSIPAIFGAGLLATLNFIERGNFSLGLDAVLAAVLAFLVALLAIVLMMRWLARASFTPFVVYRLGLGLVLLGIFYLG